MWEYNDVEHIKLFRKLLNWEWYTDINTKTLFIHCLLKANWKAGSWHGYKYDRGQFITSLPTLARETGLTERQVRTALKHLKATGEVTDWHDNKIRIITVLSYNKYQDKRQANGQSDDSQTTGKRQASDSRYKNIKNNKEGEEVCVSTPTPTPSLDEVKAYCRERGFTHVNAEKFWNLYESRNWLENGQPFKWKQRLAYWEAKDMADSAKNTGKKKAALDDDFWAEMKEKARKEDEARAKAKRDGSD